MLVTKQLTVAIDFHYMEKNTMEVNGYRQLFGYLHSLKYFILCSTEDRDSYRSGIMGWGVNDERILVSG